MKEDFKTVSASQFISTVYSMAHNAVQILGLILINIKTHYLI